MDDQERVKLALIATGLIAAAGVGIYASLPAIREGKKKRAKIKAWEQENRACIRNFQDRMKEMIDDPRYSHDDFWQAWDDENKFLSIMLNRPFYE